MTALPLIITTAGLARFTAAQVDEDIDLGITSVGLTNQVFVAAPTLTALPGQFRAVNTISGEAVGDNIVHMIVRDAAELSYTVRGFGLYLEDGTLFAVYGQEQPLFEKAAAATMFLAVDMAFPTGNVDLIEFGDTNFLNPPATTERAGVVELATAAEATAGADTQRAVTPAALRAALGALIGIGHISMWYGSAETVPAGWAICNGQTVARSDGAGNITTPDLRDRAVIGAGGVHAQGAAVGAFSKTVNSEEAGAHTHGTGTLAVTVANNDAGLTFTYSTKTDTASGGTGKTLAVPPDPSATPPMINDPQHAHDATIAGETAETGAHDHEVTIDVTQPSLALHFIMRI
ncbi:tail fiber protein [Sphingomonas koreensis]|uniref:tail fiber protein n=1 Tax=Sphingomonas koreensis TaxID=93064 RepID=UPI000F7EB7BD|nr:tail fiber protein [Sphingomonas koreensis]MDC7808790.1 tail fiber protein [Sphingomonas koreensis]RSU98930.1 hypothetical protein CA256_03100 [Sphingomonas koreensis]